MRQWWYHGSGEPPADAVEALREWVGNHSEDGESLFYLSQADERYALRDPATRGRSIRLLEEAASRGYPSAMARLGWHLVLGQGVSKDSIRGMDLLQQSVAKDDPEAHAILGMVYGLGLGGKAPDFTQAKQHLERAGDAGLIKAWAAMWLIFDKVNRGEEGLPYLRRGAEAGDPQAQFMLSKCYTDGRFVARDLREAERLGLLAAKSGDPQYQRGLGELYRSAGTPAAREAARKWFTAAKAGRDAKAGYWLALMEINTVEPDADPQAGLRLMREAAEGDVPEAQVALGHMYVEGLLVTRDLDEAEKWCRKAAAAGNSDGAIAVRWLQYARRLKPDGVN